ncbi:hypothetical protein EYF80_051738 [Liparis tanakae]|uniref:Uncharacterized protein n=1 Tax=Liparis tanakae TaxID=230148 RepID=A0A4Z2FA16_9TELE|nr:hypothetical protein EYF80_051738 [Liparis tanakae]
MPPGTLVARRAGVGSASVRIRFVFSSWSVRRRRRFPERRRTSIRVPNVFCSSEDFRLCSLKSLSPALQGGKRLRKTEGSGGGVFLNAVWDERHQSQRPSVRLRPL